MENKIKHLEMIEKIVERMGSNSFQLKGWAVTLVTIIGALAAKETDKRFFLLSFIPLLAFWFVDSFYLQTERKYKVLYRQVAEKGEKDIDFKMDTSQISYTEDDLKRVCYCRCLFSATEFWFYIPITIAVLGLAFLLKVF